MKLSASPFFQVIRVSAEHPFWVVGLGWTSAGALRPGDLLLSIDDQQLPVEWVTEAGEVTTVYNFRVADYHSYYIGSREWGFSVWAHNSCEPIWDSSAKRWRDPTTGRFTKPPAPGAGGSGQGSKALDQLKGISKAQERIRSGSNGGRKIIRSTKGSQQTVKNQLRRPYDPKDWQ